MSVQAPSTNPAALAAYDELDELSRHFVDEVLPQVQASPTSRQVYTLPSEIAKPGPIARYFLTCDYTVRLGVGEIQVYYSPAVNPLRLP